jgi:hypothetical protein
MCRSWSTPNPTPRDVGGAYVRLVLGRRGVGPARTWPPSVAVAWPAVTWLSRLPSGWLAANDPSTGPLCRWRTTLAQARAQPPASSDPRHQPCRRR